MLMPTRGFGDNQPEENPGNWIAISRDIEHHPIVGFGQPMKPANPKRGAYSKNEAWQFLLFRAEFKRKRVTNKGKLIWLERGELMGGLSWLAEQWNWSKEAVRWFLRQLENDMMIVRHNNTSDNRLHARSTGIISVCKYDKYQLADDLEHLLSNTRNHTLATPQQHLSNTTINKETNKQDSSPDGELSLSSDPTPSEDRVTQTVREAHRLYNETAKRLGLPVARVLNKSRERSLALRIKEAGGLDGFREALANLEKSSFLQGKNDRGWRADLEFVCQAKSFAKLIDGAYNDRDQTSNSTRRVLAELKAKKQRERTDG